MKPIYWNWWEGLYEIDNMALDENKQKTEWRKCLFENELENTYEIKIQNDITCKYVNKINLIAEFILLYDIIYHYKRTK